ncbi:MAG: hypothetical protein HYR55_11100 [Acidobacteria bacterium]|nr:hypothetical protein [Acidobacteriota bacterium]MBI3657725.1 hypothetical protein [Acidobacteriota bacterium]
MRSSIKTGCHSRNQAFRLRRQASRRALRCDPRIILGILLLVGLLAFPAWAFKTFNYVGGTIHQQISSILMGEGFSESSFQMIDNGNSEQDIPETDNWIDARHHFDNNQIGQAIAHVDSLRKKLIAQARTAASDKQARETVLRIFGEMLHAVQDFYSHSTYVELNLKAGEGKIIRPGDIPLVNWERYRSYPHLKTGYFFYESPTFNETFDSITVIMGNLRSQFPSVRFKSNEEYKKLLTRDSSFYTYDEAIENALRPDGEMHHLINKDNPDSPMGRLVNPETKILLHQYAFDLATRETKRQWKLLEAAILAAYGEDKGGTIVAAIQRNANVREEPDTAASSPNDSRLTTLDATPASLDEFLNAWEYEDAYFAKTLQRIKRDKAQLLSDFQSELIRVGDQINQLADLVRRAGAVLNNGDQNGLIDSPTPGGDATDPCRRRAERIVSLRRLLERSEKDEQDIEKKLYAAQALAKACKDRGAIDQAETLYKEVRALAAKVQKDVAQITTALKQWEGSNDPREPERATARAAEDYWNKLGNLEPSRFTDLERHYGNLSRLKSDVSDAESELYLRLEAFRNQWSPTVPSDVLFARVQKLQMYLNVLRNDLSVSPTEYSRQWVDPVNALKEKDARLRREAEDTRRQLYTVFSSSQRASNGRNCVNDATRELREIAEKTDTVKTLADLALTKLGKGYEEMRVACTARLNRSGSTSTAAAGDKGKSGPTSMKPAYLLRFWEEKNSKEIHFVLYAHPADEKGWIHLADGSGGYYHYPGQSLGLYKDEESLCAVLRGYKQYSVSFNLGWWGVTCPKEGPVHSPPPSGAPVTAVAAATDKGKAVRSESNNHTGRPADPLRRLEEEQRRRAEQALIHQQEEARRAQTEARRAQTEARRRQDEEQRRRAEQTLIHKQEETRRVQTEARRRQEEERRRAEQALIHKQEEARRAQTEARRRQEEEQRRRAQQALIHKQEEARRAQAAAQRRQEEEQRRRAEQVRIQKQEEARRAQVEARRRQEEEQRRRAEQVRIQKQEEARRAKAEMDRRQEEERRRRADAEKAKREEALRRPR